jgi:hypothetical protein
MSGGGLSIFLDMVMTKFLNSKKLSDQSKIIYDLRGVKKRSIKMRPKTFAVLTLKAQISF